VSPVEWVGVVSLLYLLACALQYRYVNNIQRPFTNDQVPSQVPSLVPKLAQWGEAALATNLVYMQQVQLHVLEADAMSQTPSLYSVGVVRAGKWPC
jgi:hypothetical protein